MNMNNRQHWDQEDFELEAEFEDVSHAVHAGQQQVPMVSGRMDRRIREHARFQASEEAGKSWIFSRAPQLALAASLFFGVSVYFVTSLEYQSQERPASLSEFDIPATGSSSDVRQTISPPMTVSRPSKLETVTVTARRANSKREASLETSSPLLYERQVSVSAMPVLEKPSTRQLIKAKKTSPDEGDNQLPAASSIAPVVAPSVKSSGVSWVKLSFNVNDNGEVDQIRVIESCLRNTSRDHCIDDDVHDSYAIDQVMQNTYSRPGRMEEIIFIPPVYQQSRANSLVEDR